MNADEADQAGADADPGQPSWPMRATRSRPAPTTRTRASRAWRRKSTHGARHLRGRQLRSRPRRPAHSATRSRSRSSRQPRPQPRSRTTRSPNPRPIRWPRSSRDLKLDATFVQGRDQIAIIDGRIYSKGQHCRLDGDSDELYSQAVPGQRPADEGRSCTADGRTTCWVIPTSSAASARPDAAGAEIAQEATAEIDPGGQLAMFQKLLNSPLGALGKSMIGDPAGPAARSGSAVANARAPRTASSIGEP